MRILSMDIVPFVTERIAAKRTQD